MAYRLSWIAGTLGVILALARVSRLVRPVVDGVPWQVIVVSAAALGAAITWAVLTFGLKARWAVLASIVAAALMVFRIVVPETTWLLLPTGSSFDVLGAELVYAQEFIRTQAAPLLPLAGIIAILAVVFWALGSLLSWGLLANRPYVAVLSPLVVYLEFAVMDRFPAGQWAPIFMGLTGFALLAVALDQRRAGTGLLTSHATRRTLRRSMPAVGGAMVVIMVVTSLAAGRAIADLVPGGGHLDWRTTNSLTGQYFGSISYNPFVGIRQSLIAPSNTPVFTATINGAIDPGSLYWRLVTLDSFNGVQWHVDARSRIATADELDGFEPAGHAFAGPIGRVTASVTIAALRMDWLPAPYAPVALASSAASVEREMRIKTNDGSLRYEPLTRRGMSYTVVSEVPRPDLSILALGPDGAPSAMFVGQATSAAPPPAREVPDAGHYVRLPAGVDPGIAELAGAAVAGLETDFERALALESFLRSGDFTYSTEIEPGHGAQDLAAWLLDPDSPNYRSGYCEQFATAMAVMARSVGLPTRVVLGFTPGTLTGDGAVVVRDRNAHAWVEVWMPTQGWVAFDPTPRGDGINPATSEGLPIDVAEYMNAIVDPAEQPVQPELPEFEEPAAPPPTPGTIGGPDGRLRLPVSVRSLVAFALAVGLVAAIPVAKMRRRRSRLRRLSEGDVTAAWHEIVDRLADLGERQTASATPAEIARRTSRALEPLASVYGQAVYGPASVLPADRVDIASRSMTATEAQIIGRYSRGRRLAALYNMRSLITGWPRPRNR
jgi:transglutaminase-like putative cysteine protease